MSYRIMGKRIQQKREEKNLSREALAFQLNVSRQTIYKWEHGEVKNIDRDYISKMSAIFHCDPEWLMNFDDSKEVTATYAAEGKDPITVKINCEPIMGPASLRAKLYQSAMRVKPENLQTAIDLLNTLA